MSTVPTPDQILDMPLNRNDADASTIREYLIALLAVVWREGEGFSGKRPFGNSSWEFDLYKPLAEAGYVTATIDEDGYLDVFERSEMAKADRLIADAIKHLGRSR